MKKLLLGLMLMGLGLPAYAQVNPKIVYNVDKVIYLANADGSNSTVVYSGASYITHLELKPGGGQIAFIESNTLKLLDYSVGSSIHVNSVRSVNNPSINNAEWADYSPNSAKLIYLERKGTVAYIHSVDPISAGDAGRITGDVGRVNFLRYIGPSGDKVVFSRFDYNPSTSRFTLNMSTRVLSTGVETKVMTGISGALQDMDVSRKREAVLFQVGAPSTMYDCDYSAASSSSSLMTLSQCRNMGAGMRAHYTNDDSGILYDDNNRTNLYLKDLASGVSKALLSKVGRGLNWNDYLPDIVP